MESALHLRRVEECAHRMKEAGLAALLLTKPANLFYLTGDGRWCAYALISSGGRVALGVPMTDVEDVGPLARFDLIAGFEDEVGMIHSIAHHFEEFGIHSGTVGLEYTFLTQSMMGMLTHPHAKPQAVGVADCTSILSGMRTVKEPMEIERIRRSAEAAAAGMRAAVKAVKPGATESRVAAEAERAMRLAGAEGFYRTYVSSGPRTNLAHGLPTHRRIDSGDLVMIDLAPIVDGYSADLCRTVCAGRPTAAQQAAYELYLRAQQAAIAKARAGVEMTELEAAMHSTLKEPGREKQVFGPPIHGVGIEFEEAPLPAGHAFFHGEKAPSPLEPGTVLAIGNCGLYTGPWGVRVEDTVEVTRGGPVLLTQFPCSLRK
jgi:Xaa-Pro aminopeptidase